MDDRGVLLNTCSRNLIPSAGVFGEGASKAVVGTGDALNVLRGLSRRTAKGVRERLVLLGRRRCWGRRGEIGALEVRGGEVGDAGADGGAELGNGFVDLRRVVVRLVLEDLSYS